MHRSPPAACGGGRVASQPWRSSASTSAARSRTPSCSTASGSSRRRCRPTPGRRSPCSRRRARSAPRASSASRTGRPSRRTRCSSARARGRRSSPRPGFEHLLHLRRQTRAHLYRLCAEHPAAARAARALRRRARADRAGRRARAARPRLAAGARRRGGRGLPALLVPRPDARARRSPTSCGGGCRTRTSSPRTRSRPSSASTSAPRRRRPTPTSGPSARGTSARSRARRRRPGCRAPLVMRSSGGVATLEEAAAHPALVARLRPGGGRGRRGARRAAGGHRERDLVRHGRHVDRRLPDRRRRRRADDRARRRRASAPPADRRPPHRRRRRRLDRLARRGRRAARRARERRRRPGPGLLRARRHAADGHRREPPARPAAATLAGGLELDREAAERALGRLDPADVVDVVNAEMLRALRVVSVERGHDPREFALVAFGGAGPLHACALAEELGIATVLVPAAAGVLSALGLVASDERRDRVTVVRRARSRRRASCRPRARPTCATAGQSFELTVPLGGDLARALPPRARGAVRLRRPRRARSSSSRCARPTSVPGPQLELPAGEPLRSTGPAVARARRRHVLDSPRVGGG